MGKMHRVGKLYFVTTTGTETARGPFANRIESQNGGLVERGGKEGTGRMRFVVFGKDITAIIFTLQSLVHLSRQVKLLTQPKRDAHKELPKTARGISYISFQQPLEFQERFFIEHDIVEHFGSKSPGPEAIFNRVCGKAAVVFFARKPLFLDSGDYLAVTNKCRGTVVVEGRYSQNIHKVVSIKITLGNCRPSASVNRRQL